MMKPNLPYTVTTLDGLTATVLFWNRTDGSYYGTVMDQRVEWCQHGLCDDNFYNSISLNPEISFSEKFHSLPVKVQDEIADLWSDYQDAEACDVFLEHYNQTRSALPAILLWFTICVVFWGAIVYAVQ